MHKCILVYKRVNNMVPEYFCIVISSEIVTFIAITRGDTTTFPSQIGILERGHLDFQPAQFVLIPFQLKSKTLHH